MLFSPFSIKDLGTFYGQMDVVANVFFSNNRWDFGANDFFPYTILYTRKDNLYLLFLRFDA